MSNELRNSINALFDVFDYANNRLEVSEEVQEEFQEAVSKDILETLYNKMINGVTNSPYGYRYNANRYNTIKLSRREIDTPEKHITQRFIFDSKSDAQEFINSVFRHYKEEGFLTLLRAYDLSTSNRDGHDFRWYSFENYGWNNLGVFDIKLIEPGESISDKYEVFFPPIIKIIRPAKDNEEDN